MCGKGQFKKEESCITIEEKLDILELIEKGTFLHYYNREIWNWKIYCDRHQKSKHKLEAFKNKTVDIGQPKATIEQKAIKLGAYEKLDEAHYIWFRQQQEKNIPVSGSLLQEKQEYYMSNSIQILPNRLWPAKDASGDFPNDTD